MAHLQSSDNSNLLVKYAVIFILASFFAALAFGIIALSTQRFWLKLLLFLLVLISVAFFGVLSYSLIKTSSPAHDAIYYYFGMISFIGNALGLLFAFISLFKKNG
jgi:hypothetical protein